MFNVQKYKPGTLAAVLVASDWHAARTHGAEIRRLLQECNSDTTTLSWLDKVFEEHERYYYDILCDAEITIPEDTKDAQ